MKEIAPKFEATAAEERWYSHWMQKGYFRSVPDNREPYTIVIPPPNVTGVLHMGHMLNNTIQDILIRRARMLGKNALWVPGTDHASIATEAKVVNKLKQEGIEKAQLTRDEFLKHAWEWKEKHGGIILEQLKKLGASCDWDRTVFTMDEPRYESVIKVFVDLYNKGLIYRGVRMVNWDPKALTALSDEEVIYKEVNSKLFYLRYKVVDSEDEWITIATTRPETILGDTAVCVHPNDERYQHLHGRKVLVPLVNRAVPVIADEYVDMEFGTGCLKITPAHDINDYNLGIKYKLDTIDIFNDNGTLSEAAQLFVGKDRFEVRELIIPELDKAGNLVKIEAYLNKIGFSERTDAVIEPKLSLQWFLKMEEMAKPALEVVMNDTIAFHPPKFKNTYRHWMENVRDWCISRQLWWGQRIPAWYLPNREIVVASTQTEALALANKQFPELNLVASDLKQDEDVLDTWFSSWLWPVSVFDGIRFPENEEIKYYYPTNDLITAPEILFFWVARMIMAGQEYRGDIPFRNVYLTGIVRDKLGRKMSKSLGNSPDPIALMEKYGADGVRVGMLLTSPAGNDLPFDESLCEQGRNFSNKIWNALRLVTGWNVDESLAQPSYASQSVSWFEARFAESLALINEHFDRYRLSDALMAAYKLVWDDFCSWYLEMVKPAYQQPIDAKTYQATLGFFNELLKMLHPFMPFITEEMYHLLNEKPEKDLIVSTWPQMEPGDTTLLADFDFAAELINAIRALRQEKGIANREKITLMVTRSSSSKPNSFDDVVVKLCNLEALEYVDEKPQGAFTFLVKTTEFSVPAGEKIDVKAEIAKLEADLKYAQGFLRSVMGKLNNAKFMAGAPAQVVENELKKKADAETRIKAIEEQIESLS
ncbi:MAG: valine--tRNA ligase [Bacteroidales bacterium]|nr:valine--tRNA ligase [Bacteroidales bacterium]MDD3664122.1 valine--tRNA ligase [Bacteroidales bacterium]